MTRVLPALIWLTMCTPALAVTGNAPPAGGFAARPIVMLVDERGDLCTGTALARDLVLTAAHCVSRKGDYRVKVFQTGQSLTVRSIAVHPRFDLASYAASRATADVALVKLASPLPDAVTPAALAASRRVAPGDTLTIAGFGTVANESARGLGVPRMARLTVTGTPGSYQIRLYDSRTRDERAGLGGCTGDSGAPAFDGENVIGVVSWSTAPQDEEGCGGLTGVTPLALYRGWIVETARKLFSALVP
jgi:secreted trypsin-like serine protease